MMRAHIVVLLLQVVITVITDTLLITVNADNVTEVANVRVPKYRFNIPKNDIFQDTKVIPLDHQVSAFLYQGEVKTFFFLHERKNTGLSITVTPCTSNIVWSIRFKHQNDTGQLSDYTSATNSSEPSLEEFRGREMHTFSMERAPEGLYILQVSPLDQQSYVYMYANLGAGGPPQLKVPLYPRMRLQTRQFRKRLTIRWEPSMVDPHLMHYCLVVNTRRHYATLCEAQGERFGVSPPEVSQLTGFNFPEEVAAAHKNEIANKAAKLNASRLGRGSKGGTGQIHEDIVVECIGRKTHHTLYNLEHGKVYHFNLFALNRRTNFSFSYGKTTLKFENKFRPTGLKNGKSTLVNFRKMDGRAVFKFKVNVKAESKLQLYVMPCGNGIVDVEVLNKGSAIIPRHRVESYELIAINTSIPGERFTLKVTAPNTEELTKIDALEVMASTRHNSKFPLPKLPQQTQVYEYASMRQCDSITIGWMPSPDTLVSRYCILVKEGEEDEFQSRKPNQCGLDSRIQRGSGFVSKTCLNKAPQDESGIATYTIKNLKNGRNYIIQVTLSRDKGRSLSYDLLNANTKPSCS